MIIFGKMHFFIFIANNIVTPSKDLSEQDCEFFHGYFQNYHTTKYINYNFGGEV